MNAANVLINLRVPRQEAETRISERIASGEVLLASVEQLREAVCHASGYEKPPAPKDAGKRDSLWADYVRWNDFNKELIERLFDSPRIAAEYGAAREPETTYGVFLAEIDEFQNDLRSGLEKLRSIKERLPLLEGAKASAASHDAVGVADQVVFVVHGRNELVLTQTRLLLKTIGLEPVVLRDQIEPGSPTLIEKLERHANATKYAVVLMTGDDEGRLRKSGAKLALRARQNVILEFGLFVGALTRGSVCVLHEAGIERPSDMDGVEYIPLDEVGKWKHTLGQKLHSAGFAVDLSKVV